MNMIMSFRSHIDPSGHINLAPTLLAITMTTDNPKELSSLALV